MHSQETFDLIIKQTYDLGDQFAICIPSVISICVYLFKRQHFIL